MTATIAGFVAAFLVAALPGRWVIARLRGVGARQTISEDAPERHRAKQGTPTMGGLLILAGLAIPVAWYVLTVQIGAHRHPGDDFALLPVLMLTLAYGLIGFLDDYLSARRGKNLGLRAREKLIGQFVCAIGFTVWLASTAQGGLTTYVSLAPTLQGVVPKVVDLGVWYYPLAVLYIVGLSNATNLADGLDGLSSGLALAASLAAAALVAQGLFPALSFYAVALAGALLGFLWWNANPARVFMGDTGALALGAALAAVALVGKQEIGVAVACLVFWAEAVSVMAQVTVFKWRRRRHGLEYARSHRLLRRTPLHHHFEELGWPETTVVMRFWIAGALAAAAAMLWMRS